ncbi:Endocytosis and vacuole integrity protein [Coemansia erecta]|uniref:Endocytosis and vacuole integrity protein n=1 Tax=Coemansia erecta TaxID=147472 RepID=A0A9W7Y3H3_9FUNG|nr:Endocytosis and vacuole integrity protein [Coemansia erecta]
MASTVNLRSFLQTELQTLSTEARRKHPEVKEAAERVIVVLRGIPSSSSAADVSAALRQSDEIVRPFVLACQSIPPNTNSSGSSGSAKMASIAMQSLQQLVAARAVAGRSIGEVLRTLRGASGMGVEVQVKVLQMVLPLVTLYAESVVGEELVLALHVCLALQRSRDAVVANTAAAILRQAVEEVFERVARDARQEAEAEAEAEAGEEDEGAGVRRQHERDAQFVLQDLCLLAADGEPVLLQHARPVDKRLVLELLEAVLINHSAVVSNHPAQALVLRERLAPFLVGFFADTPAFPLAVRCMRLLFLFVRHLHQAPMAAECEVFLGILARLVAGDSGVPAFCQVLAVECVRRIAETKGLLLALFAQYDGEEEGEGAEGDCHVVCDLVAATARAFVEHGAPAPGGEARGAPVSETCGVRAPLSSLLDKPEAPAVPAAYIAGQALQALAALADALAQSVLPRRTRHIDAEEVLADPPGAQAQGKDGDGSADRVLAAQTWPALLPALDHATGAVALDDRLFARMLDAAGKLVCVWGALGMQGPRDALLELMCAAARPPEAPVGVRQVQWLREAVRCAKYLAAAMGGAWGRVLGTAQAVEEALQQQQPPPQQALDAVRLDGQSVRALVRRVGPEACLWLVRGLVALGCAAAGVPVPGDCLAAAWRQPGPAAAAAAGDRPLFSTAELRLLAVAADGPGALLVADAEAWRLVTQHLLALATHAAVPPAARTQACAALSDVVLAGMDHVGRGDAACPDGSPAAEPLRRLVESGAAQRSMLAPLALLMRGGGLEARRVALDTLHRVLQAAGHSVRQAWDVAFDIVQAVFGGAGGGGAGSAALVRAAFACVQLVCSDHLADLPPGCLRRCIHVIAAFGAQREDLNVALTAVGQAWALCDFFHARRAAGAGAADAALASALLDGGAAGEAALVGRWQAEALEPGSRRTHEVLWALLLHALAALGRDRRHEVRLSAIQTLFRALDAHGGSFTPWLCDAALWAVILPLAQHSLDSRAHVLLRTELAAEDTDAGMQRVAERSGVCLEDPLRLAQRQWDEGVATALLGMAGAWAALERGVGCRQRAWRAVWALVARLAAGSLDDGDVEQRARLRTRAGVAAALECMGVLLGRTPAATPGEGEGEAAAATAWQAWLRVCQALVDVPAAAAAGLNLDADGSAVVRQETLCALLALGNGLAAALRSAGLLAHAECCALLGVARGMLVFADAPGRRDGVAGEETAQLQRLALASVALVGRVERALALGELALLAALPYAVASGGLDGAGGDGAGVDGAGADGAGGDGAGADGAVAAGQAVVVRAREAFARQLARAAFLRDALGSAGGHRGAPGLQALQALGVAAVGALGRALAVAEEDEDEDEGEEGRALVRPLLAGGVWRDAVAAMGLHMVRPLGSSASGGGDARAAEWFVRAVPAAMLRLRAECSADGAGGGAGPGPGTDTVPALAEAWAAVGTAVAHALGMAPDDNAGGGGGDGDGSGLQRLHVIAGFAGGDRQIHMLDAVVAASLAYVRSQAEQPAEIAEYWALLVAVLERGAQTLAEQQQQQQALSDGKAEAWQRRLALASFRWLFHMCDAEQQRQQQQEADGESPVLLPLWVGRAAAPRLVERCRGVVAGFAEDRRLAGWRAPMPEGRGQLLRYVLAAVARLECRAGALAPAEAEDADGDGNDDAGGSPLSQPSGGPAFRAHVLAGQSAVIFALYGCLVDLLAVEHAADVVRSVQLCLKRVEREILG